MLAFPQASGASGVAGGGGSCLENVLASTQICLDPTGTDHHGCCLRQRRQENALLPGATFLHTDPAVPRPRAAPALPLGPLLFCEANSFPQPSTPPPRTLPAPDEHALCAPAPPATPLEGDTRCHRGRRAGDRAAPASLGPDDSANGTLALHLSGLS